MESEYISNSVLKPVDSPFGHCAANPGNDKNFELQLDKNITELLQITIRKGCSNEAIDRNYNVPIRR